MIIFSGLYYTGSIKNGDLIVRDQRFYPGKYVETFYIWYQYLRKNYPDNHVVLLADYYSPIPIQFLLDWLPEKYDVVDSDPVNLKSDAKIHVKWLKQDAGKYFWPMQRNLCEAITMAYDMNEDLFWLDNDAFLNTDITSLVNGFDIAAPTICHEHMTIDSVCTYISKERLHSYDLVIPNFKEFLFNLLKSDLKETRMQIFQEGGLYKMFCYGKYKELKNSIELSHLSCYKNFIDFLARNPINSNEYRYLYEKLLSIDFNLLKGIELEFLDMNFKNQSGNNKIYNHIVEIGSGDEFSSEAIKLYDLANKITIFEPNKILFNSISNFAKKYNNIEVNEIAISSSEYLYNLGYASFMEGTDSFIATAIEGNGFQYLQTVRTKVKSKNIFEVDKGDIDYLILNITGGEIEILKKIISKPKVIITKSYCHTENQLKNFEFLMQLLLKSEYKPTLINGNQTRTFFHLQWNKV